MGNILDLDKFRADKSASDELEREYIKFLDHINKFIGPPTSYDKLIRSFYMTLRYLEGNVNTFGILQMLNIYAPKVEVDQLRNHLIRWLQGIIDDLKGL